MGATENLGAGSRMACSAISTDRTLDLEEQRLQIETEAVQHLEKSHTRILTKITFCLISFKFRCTGESIKVIYGV